MNQETLTGHLFRYTLETVCKGNRNELARRLELDPVEVRRLIRRYKSGGGSGVGGEALLWMYLREPELNLGEVLLTLGSTLVSKPTTQEKTVCTFHSMLNSIETAYREEYLLLQEKSDDLEVEAIIYKLADDFMKKLRKLLCDQVKASDDQCDTCGYASDTSECPCVRFSKYIEWLRTLLTARRSSLDM